MKYEIVESEAKIVVGKSIVTSNSDPKMGEQIGSLWCKFYNSPGYCREINNISGNAIGLYSDYVGDKYTVTVGMEVAKSENPDMTTKTIIKGKYAKFLLHGNMVTAASKAWGDIWATELERTFTGDFEEYLPCDNCDHVATCDVAKCEDCDINIYIAIK